MQKPSPALLFHSFGIGLWLLATASPAAILTVTTNADSGAGSLRQAIADAASGDTVVFHEDLQGETITLTSGELTIDKNLAVEGPGPELLTIDAANNSRVFTLYPAASTTSIALRGMTLTRGSAPTGGAVRSFTDWNTSAVLLTISNCVVSASQATAGGGGGVLKSRNTSLTMVDCVVRQNSSAATASSEGGGGVYATHDGNLTLERVAFLSNTSNRAGGALVVDSNGTIRDCLFHDNESTFDQSWNLQIGGGAVQINGRTGTIVNSTVSGNRSANPGGGVQIQSGTWGIHNSTVAGNTAGRRGGGVNHHGGTVSLGSTIVAGNTGGSGYEDVYGSFVSVTNCLVQVTNDASLPGANNIFGQSAQLVALADNGGPTRTHALQKTSPAIDKGSNPLNLATDQRGTGYPRLSGTAVDIGAYEYTMPPGGTVVFVR